MRTRLARAAVCSEASPLAASAATVGTADASPMRPMPSSPAIRTALLVLLSAAEKAGNAAESPHRAGGLALGFSQYLNGRRVGDFGQCEQSRGGLLRLRAQCQRAKGGHTGRVAALAKRIDDADARLTGAFGQRLAQRAVDGRAGNPLQRVAPHIRGFGIRQHAGEYGDGSFRSHQTKLLADEILPGQGRIRSQKRDEPLLDLA